MGGNRVPAPRKVRTLRLSGAGTSADLAWLGNVSCKGTASAAVRGTASVETFGRTMVAVSH